MRDEPAAAHQASAAALARAIDHTLLRPGSTAEEIGRLVEEAGEHGFASVCVPPVFVTAAARRLAGSAVHTGTVVGFPFGYVAPEIRIAESRRAIDDGAQELDTVLNLSWLRGGEDRRVLDDLAGWVGAARRQRADLVLKVILETGLLERGEKLRAAYLVAEAGADFVKTSTGFGPSGATVEDVLLLAAAVGGRLQIKASGGIRDTAAARALLAAGAIRLGTSSGVAIVLGARTEAAG
jgi:deoxyribose-phosphate aldolase